jgi:hypothetical protein
MRTLDRNRPYGEVFGSDTGARFTQDGVDFYGDGRQVGAPPDEAAILIEAPANVSAESISDSIDYASMHWKHLKARVEVFGGTWTNKEDGIAYLKGQTA